VSASMITIPPSKREKMMGHVVKIGRYEIVDAVMDAEKLDTVGIPCHTNPA
jgi:hypothetical protein